MKRASLARWLWLARREYYNIYFALLCGPHMKYVQKIKISARERVSERAAMRFFFRGDNRRYYVCVRFIAPRRSLWSQLEPTSSKGRREMARDNSKSLCIHLSVAMRRECTCAPRETLMYRAPRELRPRRES
jgi:hypothetical protein